jgi:hypothetical protein
LIVCCTLSFPRPPSSHWTAFGAQSGSVRRECLDHVIVLGETHLRRIMSRYAVYYNQARTHLALEKDTPAARSIEPSGLIIAEPMVAGFHHRYARI